VVTALGSALENAVCIVSVPTGGRTIDLETGNPYPNKRDFRVYLYLKYDKLPPKQLQESQPRDVPMMWVEGYVTRVIDPLDESIDLPPNFPSSNLSQIPCTINGSTVGSFFPIPRIESGALHQYVDRSVLGQPIWGWFNSEVQSNVAG
jgi:hypothetical protein